MIVNFEIDGDTAVLCQKRHLDLHNNFNFLGYEFSLKEARLTLHWEKSKGAWVSSDEVERLTMIHRDVFFLRIVYDMEFDFPEDEDTLASLSFFPSTMREINNGTMFQKDPEERDDILYVFQTEQYIRVGCDSVELILS